MSTFATCVFRSESENIVRNLLNLPPRAPAGQNTAAAPTSSCVGSKSPNWLCGNNRYCVKIENLSWLPGLESHDLIQVSHFRTSWWQMWLTPNSAVCTNHVRSYADFVLISIVKGIELSDLFGTLLCRSSKLAFRHHPASTGVSGTWADFLPTHPDVTKTHN